MLFPKMVGGGGVLGGFLCIAKSILKSHVIFFLKEGEND